MVKLRFCFASPVFVVLGVFALPVHAVTPVCGTQLSSNTTLDSDMNCPGRAIRFNNPESKNVVLDCDGFTISSDSDRVVSAEFVSGITIKNCLLSTTHDDGRGIVLTGVSKSKFIHNSIITTGNSSSAFDIRGNSSANLISRNTVHTSGVAVDRYPSSCRLE